MSVRKARVSLCMIVRDEEHNLAQCLAPIADLFDEIVIVDTGSQDNTKQIARQFTPHVHDFAWCDDFSAARNESLRHATGDWIFWLDADDRVRPEQAARLRTLLDEELPDQPCVFVMDTVLVSADANEETALVTHPRLFRRSAELRWEGRVHEQLKPDFVVLGYEPVFTDVQIEHVGYLNAALRERKSRRKMRLLRMDYAVDPNNPSTLLHLGMTLNKTNAQEARRHLLRLLEMNLGQVTFLRRVYFTLAELSLMEGKPGEAAEFTQRGLALFPDDEHLLFAEASAWYALEDYAAVVSVLEQIIHNPPPRHMLFGAIGNIRSKLAPRMLGSVQRMQKAYGAAEATLLALVRQFPTDNLSWYNLGLVYLDQVQLQNFASIVRQLLALPGGSIEGGLLTALWYLRHGDPSVAGPMIDQVIAEAPRMPRPRMLRAEWLSRCRAPLAAQIQALRDVLRVQPGNTEAVRWLQAAQQLQSAPAQAAVDNWSTSVVLMPGVPIG
jgi:glycosyltransferase involved in cell wall biosynthesis